MLADNIMYETKRNSKGTPAASRASNNSAERRWWNPRGCQDGWLFRQFGGTMARCSQKRWSQSPRTQADTRSAKETFGQATSKVRSSAKQRPDSFRLQTNLWTLERIAVVIRKKFRVCYHPSQVWRILRQMGYSCQKPERRSRERDEEAIAIWRKSDWPRIKKSPKKR